MKENFYLESDVYKPTAQDLQGGSLSLRGRASRLLGISFRPLPYRSIAQYEIILPSSDWQFHESFIASP